MLHRRAFRNLAAYLKQTGTTRQALAKRVGVHPSHISRIVRGKKVPSLPLAAAIANETNIPIESLVEPNK